MNRNITNRKGQAILSEYVMVFFIVMGMITFMTVYFKRAVQAGYFQAQNYMVDTVYDRADTYYIGNFYPQYVPYYTNEITDMEISTYSSEHLLGGGSTGIYRKRQDDTTVIRRVSDTAPPINAD